MSRETMLIGLILVTFLAVIAWGIWQRGRTKKSQEQSGDPEGHKATSDAVHTHGQKTDH